MSDIGILGGTFDPIHRGHLCIAEASLSSGGMSKVILMPAKVSPFKLGREMASEEDRLAMAKLTAERNAGLEVSDIEILSEGVSYTFRTLTTLHELDPDEKYWLIVGSDQFLALESWYKGRDILENFQIILAPRPGYRMDDLREKIRRYATAFGTSVRVVENDMLDISSTEIKKAIRAGNSISGMVTPEIERYIYEHGLYREIHNG
jgi:nicotinate-nucleotide adenylyltransferase